MDIITKTTKQKEIISIVDEEMEQLDLDNPSVTMNKIQNKMLMNDLFQGDLELYAKAYFTDKLLNHKEFHHEGEISPRITK